MNPLSAAIATGAIVTVAQVVQQKKLTFRQVAAVGIYAVMLAGINEANPDLAQKFALLVLIGVTFAYALPVIDSLGIRA